MNTIECITESRVLSEGRRTYRLLPMKVNGFFIWKTGRSTLTVSRDINFSRFPVGANTQEIRRVLKHYNVI